MNATPQAVERFLKRVDKTFPVSLSEKQDLHVFSQKLCEKATLCLQWDDGDIVAMVAGYTDRVTDHMAYISVVATVPEAQGKGYASALMRSFLEICKQKHLAAVHLYAVRTNIAAMAMYRKLGFEEWIVEKDPRPNDAHLIYRI